MEDERLKAMAGNRLVKFTYVDLPGGRAFLTAPDCWSRRRLLIILRHAEHPYSRDGVERRFHRECPPFSS